MSRKTKIILSVIAITVLLLGGLGWMTVYYSNLPENLSQHETIVLGQSELVPGSTAALRVAVRDSSDAAPLAGATVNVMLQPDGGGTAVPVFNGTTNDLGTADISFEVPDTEEDSYTLVVETESELGSDKLERTVTLDRDYRILLTSDKPLYQPGQLIHLRALALSTFDLAPAAGQELQISIADGKGNTVFRDTISTSDYGVAATDFQLANEVNTGPYKISAQLGNTSSEMTVTVERYVLPKFAVNLTTEKPYYLPGEIVRGTLSANYFFGKTVSEGEVLLEGFTFDFERVDVFTTQGITDAQGNYSFEFQLPEYIAGTDLEGGMGAFFLQTAVTDQTNHTESSSLSFPVAANSIVIEAVPESGEFRPGVENILYVLTSYPDGTPVQTDLTIELYYSGETINTSTGQYGLAEVPFTPNDPWQEIYITATDTTGATASREFFFEGSYQEESVLLRMDKPVYRVGETMVATVLSNGRSRTAYLDIIREGQTVSTRAVPMEDGQAQIAIDVSPDLFGTLEMHAYVIPRSGNIQRDTRIVLVEEADDLALVFNADKEEYRPGETAVLDINVTGEDGSGAPSAIGMAIVDESVFALAEQDPGFAKLYFLLEQELLQPKYDLHGFSVPDLLTAEPVLEPGLRTAQEGAAKASLAEASLTAANFSLQGNSHDDAVAKARSVQQEYFTNLSTGLFLLWLLVPLAIIIISGIALRREKRLWGSIGLAFGFIVLLIALGFAAALGAWLNEGVRYGSDAVSVTMFLLMLLVFIAAIVVGVMSFRRKNRARSRGALAFAFVVLFIMLGFTGAFEAFFDWLFWYGPDEGFTIALLLLLLVSFITLIVMAWRKRDGALGWVLGLLIPFVLLLVMIAFASDEGRVDFDSGWVTAGVIAASLVPLALLMRAAGYVRERRWVTAVAATYIGLFSLALPIAGFSAGAMGGRQEVFMEDVAVMEMAAPMAANEVEFEMVEEAMAEGDVADDGNAAAAGEPPRLRQFFPETMFWLPDGETDANGQLTLDIPVADSITTWRLTALASTQDGRLGSATGSLRVFQDFFIDLDLPLALTVGDEIAVPVGVFNYLPEAQTVTLTVEQENWFELLDDAEKSLTIEPNDITVVYFRIKANEFGMQPFQVTAIGSQMSDAILKSVRVFPNGKEIRGTASDRLAPDVPVTENVFIPEDAIPGTQGITVKIYPGVVSQVVEGLDSILRMPNGCFEQTSSSTYPNVLVLDYLKTSGQASPEAQFKAEDYINIGYQRLTTFEVSGGGFSLFGNPPSDRMLTAYGLQEFADMSRVHDVDPQMIERAANWLLSQQMGDGSWENDQGLVHESTWSNLQNDRLPVTAYIVWSLIEAGFGDNPGTQTGLSYVREHASEVDDAYVLALVANALTADAAQTSADVDGVTQRVLDQLAGMAVREGNTAVWNSGVATFIGSEGATGSIETTALVALAFLRVQVYPDLTNEALTALIQQKDSFGTWHNTQSTVLALKALIATVRSGAENVNASVTIQLNSGQTRTVEVTPETFDVVQMVTFDDINLGDNVVSIDVQGEGNLMYQVTNSFYLPWEVLSTYPQLVEPQELVSIDVTYDRTELVVDDSVTVDVTVTLNEEGARTDWALIDLGIPPGFAVNTEDLTTLVEASKQRDPNADVTTFERFELTGRQVLVYLGNLQHGQPFSFSYRLTAKFPLRAQTPASNAYDYYNPDVSGEAQPQEIVVVEG